MLEQVTSSRTLRAGGVHATSGPHTPLTFRSRVFRLAHLIFRLAAQAKRAELGDDSKVGSEDEGDDEDDNYEVEAIVGYNSEEALYEVHVRASQVATLHAL